MDETTAMNKDVVLACQGIDYSYGELPVLKEVSLELKKGEYVSVLGQSGTGKTTLFNVLAGLDEPTSGVVHRSATVGYMLQKDMLLPWKRLIDNVSLPFVLGGDKRGAARQKALPFFERFGLMGLEYRYPSELSGGQQKRAAFLRTFLYSNGLMLLDEPFTGLDAITRDEMYRFLLQNKKALGLSILLVTHDIEEAITLSDRLYVLSNDSPATLWPPLVIPREENEQDRYIVTGQLRDEVRRRIFSPILKSVE